MLQVLDFYILVDMNVGGACDILYFSWQECGRYLNLYFSWQEYNWHIIASGVKHSCFKYYTSYHYVYISTPTKNILN